MTKKLGFRKDFWLTIIFGAFLVVLILWLGMSFFSAIKETQIKSRKEFLRKQTELAANELEAEMQRYAEAADFTLKIVEEEYPQDENLTANVRRLFNNYPGLVDTLWVKMQDSVLQFTLTDRNDFLRTIVPELPQANKDSDYSVSSEKIEMNFALNLVQFSRNFVAHYYLNKGGNKMLMLNGKLISLTLNDLSVPFEFDESVRGLIEKDVSEGVIGVYEMEWMHGDQEVPGILVQYPFDFGKVQEDAALMFAIESETIISGVYNTYLLLFTGIVFLLIATVIFLIISIQNNLESQKKAEKNAKEISELFDQQNLLLKELHGFVYYHNYKGEMTRVSDEVEQILGHPKNDFLMAFKMDHEGRKDVLNIKSLVKKALEENRSFIDLEYDYVRPDGEKLRLRIFEKLVFDDQGRFNGGLGICTDVTDQYQRKQELIQSGNRLQTLIDNIPDVIFLYDNEGKIQLSHVKDQKHIFAGWKEFKGKNLMEIIPEAQRAKAMNAFYRARESGSIQTIDLEFPVDKESQFLEVRFFPLDKDRMMSISKDITSQRIWEKGLVEAMNAADQASKAKSEFLANMSHEIRTPMNGLLGIIDLLEQTELTKDQLQYLYIIKRSGNSLLSIIKDILDYSKIEVGKIELNPTVFSPKEEFERQVELFSGLAQQKGVDINIQFGDRTEELREGDAGKIAQVILNIVGNALKFTPKGGEVNIAVTSEEISEDLHMLRCIVQDSGIGIPKEEIPRLTDPFYQVESSNARSYQGTGLGLAIAKKIVELMGGELIISSVLNKGSEFSFTVILKRAPEKLPEQPSSMLSRHMDWRNMALDYPLRLLLAEDNKLNLQLMTMMLDQLGYAFDVAKNGNEVLEKLQTNEYDLILMDVQMPAMNGLEATRKIREMGKKGELFILGLSANVFDEDQKKALEAGMDDYLTKPIRLYALAEKIKFYSMKVLDRQEEE